MGNTSPDITVSVIIVSYNTREMTLKCLRTTFQELDGINSDVWVVDNASADGSIEAIRREFPQVHAIPNPRNAGFSAANNLAMQQAKGKFFLLVNSDAFLEPGSVRELIECAERHPDAAVIGPRLLNEDRSLQISCYRFPTPGRAWLENLWISSVFSSDSGIGDYRKWKHDQEKLVDSVTGACMLVRREAFERTGGFDERFFMYQEETDWQKTLRESGWTVVFTPGAQVVHLGGASGKSESVHISNVFFESLDLYERKHHGFLGLAAVRGAMVVGCSFRAVLWAAVSCVFPGKRPMAVAKSRMHCKLVVRQATHWKAAAKSSPVQLSP